MVSQSAVPKRPTLLILGGTSEARALARRVADAGLDAVYSYAGRTATPVEVPVPTRTGGFGGVEGLTAYLREAGVTHLVDATHPFAATISRNAAEASARAGVPLIALTRPPWEQRKGDDWLRVADIAGAVAALQVDPLAVFLAIGRQEVERFAAAPAHRYLLRFVDAPDAPPALPDHKIVVARGPFDEAGDRALMEAHGIELVVSKNAGGEGAYAKIAAARALGLPVLMIDRPALPARREVAEADAVMDWIAHGATLRGV